ncbi:MAG TPA: UDP-2,3-diacylglucosamine diphosphatase LpxI [Acidobacteriota bacterium]|nr:UDP-2,3-diacylglucosamine diphosphatase LpxI [Acidobacteriota bacterium]
MYGLIAGNGRFPLLVLEEALRRGEEVTVAAIREEADPSIEAFEGRSGGKIRVHWLGLGRLGRLLKIFARHGVTQAMMAGQVKHVRIFARDGRPAAGVLSKVPDLKMLKVLLSLPQKNTASLIGAFAEVLAGEGIELIASTHLVPHLLPERGVLTRRGPDEEEVKDVEYGRRVASALVDLDIGQTVVIKDQAVVAVEAMEGTDAAIRRAARLAEGRSLTVVKAARPGQDMRFDVPVMGLKTLQVLEECNVTAFAIDAGKTLLLDREELLKEADRMGLALLAQ